MRKRLLAFLAVLVLATTAGFAVGCGDDDDDGGDTGTGGTATTGGDLTATPGIDLAVNEEIANAVPADLKSKGTLTVATDATYPPMEFFGEADNTTVIGADADLAKALGQVMGLDLKLQNVTFDAILPGIEAGRYDVGMSSFTDTKEREATVDFVTYAQAGSSFFSPADGDTDFATTEDLCDKSVAVEKGTTQQEDAEAQGEKCSVDVQVFPDQNAANLAISSGRADAGMADSPVAAYIVEQSGGQFKLDGAYGLEPYGIALPKGSALAQPLSDAVQAIIDDGAYQEILDYWQLPPEAAIEAPVINGAIS